MTYNVNFGIAGDREGVAIVGATSPDIVLLQETNAAWADAFVRGLGTRFPAPSVRATRDWPRADGRAVALADRARRAARAAGGRAVLRVADRRSMRRAGRSSCSTCICGRR